MVCFHRMELLISLVNLMKSAGIQFMFIPIMLFLK